MIELRDYQEEAIAAVYAYFAQGGQGHPLVCLPTGTGKGYILGEFIRRVITCWPTQRIIALTHVKELIQQNAEKIYEVWPQAPLGVFSAGLRAKDHIHPIVYGGVASVVNAVDRFGHRDLMFIDEAHLLSPHSDSQYQQVIYGLKQINPHMRVIGLTATPFRLRQGMLTQSGTFTDICFNLCDVEGFDRLIRHGYMAPLIPKQTKTELNVSKVSINHGEFNQTELQSAVDTKSLNYAVVQESLAYAYDRKAWLVFCSGIEHSEHIAELLEAFGIPCGAVHSKMPMKGRDRTIKAFKAGELRAITNNNILTTGFDYPDIDFICMLRPTISPSLWVQMLGRGTRPAPGKHNCLVMDFARNSVRLGPIDDPRIPGPAGASGGDMPVKVCDACGTYCHPRVRFCPLCGAEFDFAQKIVRNASSTPLMSTVGAEAPIVEIYNVDRIFYSRHVAKTSGRVNIKVGYACGIYRFNEFVSFDHTSSYPLHRAHEWWRQRSPSPIPANTDLALDIINGLRTPKRIKVWTNKKPYPEVVGVQF